MSGDGQRFLLIAGSERGRDFLRESAQLGFSSTLLTLDALRGAAWPLEAVDDFATMPAGLLPGQILNTVSWMARGRRFDRIVALDPSDVPAAALVREHLRVRGMGSTTAAYYSDRLAMRIGAQESGFLVPDFCRVLNYDEMRDYMERVPPPWLLEPRFPAPPQETRRIEEPEQLWRLLDEQGDRQSHYLLEPLLEGDLYHVDSIVCDRQILFSAVLACGRPTVEGRRADGIFTLRTPDHASREFLELTALNAGLTPALGMVRGLAHATFLRARADGRFYFLGIAPCVGSDELAAVVEAASGLNLWREWARLEAAALPGRSYVLPELSDRYAGGVFCPAGGGGLDLTSFKAPEVLRHIEMPGRAGILLRSPDPQRMESLAGSISTGLAQQFLAPAQPV